MWYYTLYSYLPTLLFRHVMYYAATTVLNVYARDPYSVFIDNVSLNIVSYYIYVPISNYLFYSKF